MFPADNNPADDHESGHEGQLGGGMPDASHSQGEAASKNEVVVDRESAEMLATALAAPAPDSGFIKSLGERLQGDFALIHGVPRVTAVNGAAANLEHDSGIVIGAENVTESSENLTDAEEVDSDEAIAGNIAHRRAASSRRWWTVAAASLLIGMVVWSGRPSYSWAGMIEAVRQQPWTQSEFIQSGVIRVRRWVSADWANGNGVVAASSSNGSLRFVDANLGFAYSSQEQGNAITKDALAKDQQVDDWQWLLSGLLGAEGEERFNADDWRFLEDTWRRGATYGDRDDLISLRVKFQASDGTIAEIEFLVDPDTQLPLAARHAPAPRDGETPSPTAEHDEVRFAFADDGPQSIYDLGADRDTPVIDPSAAIVSMRSARDQTLTPPLPNSPVAGDEQTKRGMVGDEVQNSLVTENATVEVDEPRVASIDRAWSPLPEKVLPPAMEDSEFSARIDELLSKHWASIGVEPVGPASDEELLRRLQLDLTGRIPTVGEVRIYLEDSGPGRRERLVESLLLSRDHATHFASMWRRALIPRGVDLTPYGGPRKLEEWLADRLQKNTPHSQLARELLLAEGRIRESGPLLFYAALKLNPEELAARSARTFLGTRLECAQCHDHPFDDRISQEDFWAFAANFARISRPRGMIEVSSPVLRVQDIDRGEVTLPDTETVVPPRLPLTDRRVVDGQGLPSRREQLVNWLASPHNQRFARATVNRVWAHLFGRGLVEPIDDIRDDSTALVPEVLDVVAEDFARSRYDMRRLIRCLVMTNAYQLTSAHSGGDGDLAKTDVFARMNIKPFTAEQLHDAIAVASKSAAVAAGNEYGLVRFGDTGREAFIRLFESPDDQSIDYQAGIPQALTLMHGQLIHSATDVASSGMLKSLSAPFFSDKQRIDTLFLATLSRLPSDAERERMQAYVATAEDQTGRRQKLGDVLWALLNSAEFTLNH